MCPLPRSGHMKCIWDKTDMETYRLLLSAGDGVGAELIEAAKGLFAALERPGERHFELTEITTCGAAIARCGTALRDGDLALADGCRAILFGNLGAGAAAVPALQGMRGAFRVCTNIRPVWLSPSFEELSPLKSALTRRGMDILIVRDLMGGMINGEWQRGEGREGREASDLEYYNEQMIEHSAAFAFAAAAARRGRVTSVDKANVLASGKLWRSKVCEIATRYPGVALEHDYVDHAAMELLTGPDRYDVVLTSNVFGDILSDEAAQISGAPWLFGSAEIAEDGRGVYTPNQLHHPQSEELAGKGLVNPCCIFSAAAMLLRYSCGLPGLANAVDEAVRRTVDDGLFTGEAVPRGGKILSTEELAREILARVKPTA